MEFGTTAFFAGRGGAGGTTAFDFEASWYFSNMMSPVSP